MPTRSTPPTPRGLSWGDVAWLIVSVVLLVPLVLHLVQIVVDFGRSLER